MPAADTISYRFVAPDGEKFVGDVTGAESLVQDIWDSKVGPDGALPLQLSNDEDEAIILRFCESMPDPYRSDFDAMADRFVVCARFEKDAWNLLWAIPIRSWAGHLGEVGELKLWGERITVEEMRKFR